jgi:hypothetical protein
MKIKLLLIIFLFLGIYGNAQTWHQTHKLVSTNRQASDGLGREMATHGNYLVIGVENHATDENGNNNLVEAGAVYVFSKNNNEWTQTQKLVASDRQERDSFGRSVAISSNYIVVGAANEKVYIFEKQSNDQWTEIQVIQRNNPDTDDFGNEVAIYGDYISVGAKDEGHVETDNQGNQYTTNEGAVFIFKKQNNTWQQIQWLEASDEGSQHTGDFGSSIVMHEEYIFIGNNEHQDGGMVYVFKNNGADSFSEVSKFKGSDTSSGDSFGDNLSFSNNVIAVSAPHEDEDENGNNTIGESGSVYIFKLNASGVTNEVQKITASNSERAFSNLFGISIDINDNYLAVGTLSAEVPFSGGSANQSAGAIFIYQKQSDDSWVQMQKLNASEGNTNDQFGSGVLFNNDFIFGGAPGQDYDSNGGNFLSNTGSVYIFDSTVLRTEIPDANFESYIEAQGWGNGIENDGWVDTEKIKVIESIDIGNKNITDLTGIQDFIALKELICRDNQLTTLNISANILLENLDCFSNSLTTLDLSTNTKLKELHIGSNAISSIDISMLPDLRKLWCFNNQLTELNLVSNSLLEVLNCSTNNLSSLNLYSNSSLNVLYCDSNNLTYLDLTLNTSLSQLTCSSNTLSNLNVKNGNNTNINTFFTTSNPNLTCIEVDDDVWSTTNWTNIDGTSNFSTDCAPPNNECSQAILLAYNQLTPGDTFSGTSSGDASCASGNNIADVWFKFIASANGEFSAEGIASNNTLKFAVYDACSNGNELACGGAISLTNLTPNNEYFLKVWLESDGGRNANTTGGFTFTIRESSVLSVENIQLDSKKIVMFPNPTSQRLHINLYNQGIISKVQYYNMFGQLVKASIINKRFVNDDVSNLPIGIYIIKILGEGKVYSRKLSIR